MEQTGQLLCSVYTSQARIPVEGALVLVTQPGPGNQPKLLALRITDRSGKTAPIPIPTPPVSASTAPGTSQSWTAVAVAADHPGYARVRVDGVQIFSGVTTVQSFELLPLPLGSGPQAEQEQFTVPGQPL